MVQSYSQFWRADYEKCYFKILIRKSKDYIYGIWVYKALGIWKGYHRVKKSLVSHMKPRTEARDNKYMKYHSKLTYQLSSWNVSRKVDYHAGGKWSIHGPKRRKENQLPSLNHVIYAAWEKIVKSLVEVLYSFIEESRNWGRHDGGLASVEWKNCSPLIEKIEWNSDEPFLRNPF